MKLLIDGDLVAYRTACSVGDNEHLIYKKLNQSIMIMLAVFEAEDYRIFLSGKEQPNFRRVINPEYKANRNNVEKPYWLPLCLQYLSEVWEAEYVQGCEADDALGWFQTEDTVICTIDKDLNMIPGKHYNFVKDSIYDVTPWEALQFFYKQMLIGDVSDNIKGISKIGPVKAAKLIDILETEQEMFDVVYNKYNDPKRFVMNACCLWIQQQRGITWAQRSQHLTLPKDCQQEVEAMSNFMTSIVSGTSMEPTMIHPLLSGIQFSGIGMEVMEKLNEH